MCKRHVPKAQLSRPLYSHRTAGTPTLDIDTAWSGAVDFVEDYVRPLSDYEKPLILQSYWKPLDGHCRRFEIRLRSQVKLQAIMGVGRILPRVARNNGVSRVVTENIKFQNLGVPSPPAPSLQRPCKHWSNKQRKAWKVGKHTKHFSQCASAAVKPKSCESFFAVFIKGILQKYARFGSCARLAMGDVCGVAKYFSAKASR